MCLPIDKIEQPQAHVRALPKKRAHASSNRQALPHRDGRNPPDHHKRSSSEKQPKRNEKRTKSSCLTAATMLTLESTLFTRCAAIA
jgi:hypothetical protein